MPAAEATVAVAPTRAAERPVTADGPAGDVRRGHPDAGVAAAPEARLRRWYREVLLDARLLGLALVVAVMVGLIAALI